MDYIQQICRICSTPLLEEEQADDYRVMWNDDKKHPYHLYCPNSNCGIRYLRMIDNKEYAKFKKLRKKWHNQKTQEV